MPDPTTPKYTTELYNEKNFFYEFVHPVLYDERKDQTPVILHYERQEAYSKKLTYEIDVIANDKNNRYKLTLKSIGLNMYSTGTGSLVFYLENYDYPEWNDVLRINQFGRRTFPPFLGEQTGLSETKKSELPHSIALLGLNGSEYRYFEDFEDYHAKTD